MAALALLFSVVLAGQVVLVVCGSAASAVEEARKVSHFTGISVSDGIEVHANNTSADHSSSLMLSASPEVMSYVRSYVDQWGTLILSKAPGAGSSRVVAKAVVPGPLTYAGATSGGRLIAGTVAGSVVVSSQAEMEIKTLEASKPISITASSYSSVKIDGGKVSYITASASSFASMQLGELHADSATVSVSSRSSFTGMTVGSATVSVSSSSSLTMRATEHVGLSCSSSEVHLSGGAKVTQYSNWACKTNLSSMKAAVAAEGQPAKTAKAAGAVAPAVEAASAVEEARQVPHFTGISASDGIEVHANTSAHGSSSLSLSASPEMMSYVRSYVDPAWGILVLAKAPGAGSSRVVAKVSVPGPLTYAGASSGGSLFADSVAGAVVAASYAEIKIKTLEASEPISISASSHSSLKIDGGKVPFITASVSDFASMQLGELHADTATVSASSRSSITGMTVGSATVSVSSGSSLTMRATERVGLSCSSSEVSLSGGAEVTPYSNWACKVNLANVKAAVAAEDPPAKSAKAAGAAAPAVEAASVPPHRRLTDEPVLV